jgi:hypothetical protein
MRALDHADGTDKHPEATKAEDGKSDNQEDINNWDEVDAEALCLVQLCIVPTL